jgi:glycosyltransferase involved in cell wall biosynthesis
MAPGAASTARQRLDHVFTGSIETFLATHKGQTVAFDYIVFGDVLEHLVDPVRVLRQCCDLLQPQGKIIASIPNVAHLSVRLMLLEGRWEYSDLGLLDRTHLRFFTRASIVELFSDTGFALTHVDAVRLPVEDVDITVNPTFKQVVSSLLSDSEQDVFQYVVMAHQAADAVEHNRRFLAEKALRVLCLLPIVDWSLGNIRLRHPLDKWQQLHGGIIRVRPVYDFQPEDVGWADVVILQREADPSTLGLIDRLQKLRKKIVFDIDDLLTDVPSFLSVYHHCLKIRPYLEQTLRMVDGITVPTRRLKEKMEVYNPHVYLVPNCAEMQYGTAKHYATDENLITLVVASSDTVRVDFLVPALQSLMADAELRLRLIGIGPPGRYLADRGLPVACLENMPYDQFRLFLASLDNAIGLIALDNSVFSACKSAIKFVDYSLAGIPSVCSAVPPYSDVLEHGVTGILVADDQHAWHEAVKRLALAATERERLVLAAQRYCCEHLSLTHAAAAWHDVLTTVQAGQGASLPSRLKRRVTVQTVGALWRRHGLRPAAYKAALRILSQEGLRGVRARLHREW